MQILRILLSLCALHALYRLADDTPSTARTAYLPIGFRRVWSVLALVLTLLCYFTDAWWAILPAMAAHLGAMICRNVCIRWDKKHFCISGALGLRWDYEYAQVRYLPGKWPLLITNNRCFILWPRMVWRDTFIAEAREYVRVAAYSQIYRKRAYKDTKQNAASRGGVWSNTALALLLAALFAMLYWPITENTGELTQMTLQGAWERSETQLGLNFTGAGDYRIALNDTTRALLEPEAYGKTYTVQQQYRSSGSRSHHSRWYQVIALTDEDGVVYRTWQESADALAASSPYGLAALTLTWFMFGKNLPKPKRRK